MQFEFTEEQRMIASMAEEFSRAKGTSEKVRQAMESEAGYLPEVWRSLSTELGLCGLLVPESAGGQGLTIVEMALVFEQLGKTLLPSPLLTTGVLSVAILDKLGQTSVLEKIARGESRCTAAYLVEGTAQFVLDAAGADHLILADMNTSSVYIVDKPGSTTGLIAEPIDMMDQTRRMASVSVTDFGAIEEYKVATGTEALAAMQVGFDMARIALGAEAMGAAQECLARTVEYARERVQFGRTIGSFQAVKHQLADMMVVNEAAISAVYFAACTVSENPGESPHMAALAKVQASEALSHCAARMIQLHGGIGFTWEHDAHLYFKRARSTSTLFGLNSDLDETIAQEIGLEAYA